MVAQHLDGFDLLNIESPGPTTNLLILLVTKCVTILNATLDVLANSFLFTHRERLAAQRYTRKALLDLGPQTARPSQDSENVSMRIHCLRMLC